MPSAARSSARAGRPVEPLVERDALLRSILPTADPAERRRLDTVISTLKLEHRSSVEAVAADPAAGPRARAFVAYERALAASGGLDFDDLVARALTALETDPALLGGWREACTQLLVDEVQDVDRSQLRLALLLAAPGNRIFLVGDDDQSIYGWRLADVRRVLRLAERLPGLRRHDLVTNFRCPAPVVERAVRLIEGNDERFAKRIVARPDAIGRLILAPDPDDDDERARHVFAAWDRAGVDVHTSRAILARTNRELVPAAIVAIELGIPFRAERLVLPLEDPRLEGILVDLAERASRRPSELRRREHRRAPRPNRRGAGQSTAARASDDAEDGPRIRANSSAAVLAWAAPFSDAADFVAAVRERQAALARLRTADATLVLATAHSTKGLEFDHVAVIDMDEGRFPSRRTLDEADDPARALEEERRLAYVAWTRARRSLTLVYDPATPSPFLLEAFVQEELS